MVGGSRVVEAEDVEEELLRYLENNICANLLYLP